MFGMRHYVEWSFLQFSIVLLQPIFLLLLATFVLPGSGATDLDLRANYFAQRSWFFGLFLSLLMVSVVKDLVRSGSLPEPINLAFHAAMFVIGGSALVARRDLYHRVLAFVALLLIVAYISLLFAELA